MKSTAFLFSAMAVLSLSARSIIQEQKVDYQTAQKAPSLAVPPDLVQLSKEGRYNAIALPQSPAGTGGVSANKLADVTLERIGDQRYLLVARPPEVVWSRLADFWKQTGFNLVTESASLGIMETDWAENRAKIPQDFVRRTLGKLVDGLYDTGLRDLYRTRIERVGNNTEIFITHRGLEEIAIAGAGGSGTTFKWQARPRDLELEFEMTRRLMQFLSGGSASSTPLTPAPASASAANGSKPQPTATPVVNPNIVSTGSGWAHAVPESQDRATRKLQLALDRSGFTIEEQNRATGRYLVRLADLPEDAGKKGAFNFFGSSSSSLQKFNIALQPAPAGGLQVGISPQEANATQIETARRLLSILMSNY